MALADFQAFIVERLQQVDNTLDLTSGSPYDTQVIQPILRRLGTDPFSVDIGLFIQTTLNQNFPSMPTKEGDAITDLLIKAAIVLWNPIVREISRVANAQSVRDPSTLTTDEADALGANIFATRATGDFASGPARIYFAQAQNVNVTPANYITTKTDLHFFPTEVQSIRLEEMLLNLEGTLYYFDINVVAEAAGDQYNIGPDELVTIANLASATRITNKVRYRAGVAAEDAVTFIDRIDQELTERSLVTQRGVVAKVTGEFPEVTRLNVVGFNDVEMKRDVLTGGGLGALMASGFQMLAEADGEGRLYTRRVTTTDTVDFTALIGPPGAPVEGYVVTLVNGFPSGSLPVVRDLTVKGVVDAQTLDFNEQVVAYGKTGLTWMLRQQTLTLSGIPGGILFPDTPQGTISIPNNQVHVGGATDIFVRGAAFDSDTLLLSAIVDDDPLLLGTQLQTLSATQVQLMDLVEGGNYAIGDTTYTTLQNAAANNLSIQILDPPNAGDYRILQVVQTPAASPVLVISPALTSVPGNFRWRLSDSITIDLVAPKETKVAGSDLRTIQGSNVIDTVSGVDFDDYGVSANDIIRITTGNLIVGDYVVQEVLSPLYTQVRVDRLLPATVTGAKYSVFRPNAAGGLTLPFIRVDSIALLDTAGQPVGTTIPYANPIDIRSQSFANSAHGVKADLTDVTLGIVSSSLPAGVTADGTDLFLSWGNVGTQVFSFTGTNPMSLSAVIAQFNAQVSAVTGGTVTRAAVLIDGGNRIGVLPFASNVQLLAGSLLPLLFPGTAPGSGHVVSARDITSATLMAQGGWASLRPALDAAFDVAQVLDGSQIGFYGGLVVANPSPDGTHYDPLQTDTDFFPEFGRHIQVGSRSLGSARLYFLDPTSFEVDAASRFTLTNADGSELVFLPDPTNTYQRIPALPAGVKPVDGQSGGALATNYFQSLTTDFISKGIQPGDHLVIDYVPLLGTVELADPIANLGAKTLVVSINGGADKTIIFVHDLPSIPGTDVSRQGAVDQINKIVGQVICTLTVDNELQFNPGASVIIRGSSAGTSANPLLGFSTTPGTDQNNDAPNKGTYVIDQVGPGGNPNQLVVASAHPFPNTTDQEQQQFKVFREGLQRIVSTTMATNTETAGLYYFDVELISLGTGDQYNIPSAQPLTATGYRSDGYYLTTDDPNLTFSPVERPKLHLSRSILDVGVSDDPANATQLAGQNIQLNYDRSELTNNVDNYIRSDTERVINQSPLGRHLIPYFVRFTMTYAGGSKEDVLIPDIEAYITALYPSDTLDVSNLEKLANNRGARTVNNPIDLIAVIHNFDRTLTVERSQSSLNTGTLAAFIPDVLQVTRRLA